MSAETEPRTEPDAYPVVRAPWRYLYEYQLIAFRRVWRASLTNKVLTPALFLVSMGVGLGSLVNGSAGGITVGGRTVPYLLFVTPALVAVQAMTNAMSDSSWPVLGAIKWFGTYHAMLATPASVGDILVAHLALVTTQVAAGTVVFMVIGGVFGGFASWTALWGLLLALLVGLAFAAPTTALSAHLENDSGFNLLFRLGQTPLLLFSGTFFPIDQLPAALRPLAWVTPLWHGVEAERALSLGTGSWLGILGHVAALAVFAVVGGLLAYRGLRIRLLP